MRITLVVPRLLALPAASLARDPALSRIAALAAAVPRTDLDAALLADLALDTASAPLAALGAGLAVGRRWVIRADPVTMVVGRDDARLAGFAHDLDAPERALLLALLNGHFSADGLAFAAPRADAWFATSVEAHAVDTTSAERAIGGPLRSLLPSGAEGARWRRWFTEAQMLLHEHPLSERAGASVNALWFYGGGRLPEADRVPPVRALAAPGRAGDLLRGIARVRGGDAPNAVNFDEPLQDAREASLAVALAPVETPEALAEVSRRFLVPALDALDRGRASSVTLIADGLQGAATWEARAPSWLHRLTRRRARFIPTPPAFHE